MNCLLLLVALFALACASIRHFLQSAFRLQRLREQSSALKLSLLRQFATYPVYSQAKQRTGTAFGIVGLAVVLMGPVMKAQTAHFYAAQSTIGTGLDAGIAIDRAGSVYVTDGPNDRVLKETLSGGTYTQSTIVTLHGGSRPDGIAIDAKGSLYIASFGGNLVLKETFSAGAYIESVVPTSGLNSPSGVIVDGSGALYISDSGNNRILKESPTGNTYVESIVGSDLHWPTGLALDNSGNLYVGSYFSNTLLKEHLL